MVAEGSEGLYAVAKENEVLPGFKLVARDKG
jgi:hypothetical protein